MQDVILFLIKDATRTGAPLLLLNNLKWIKQNSEYKFIFLFERGGYLIEEYKSLGQVYILTDIESSENKNGLLKKIIFKIYRKLHLKFKSPLYKFFFELKYRYNILLIYSNTPFNRYPLTELKKHVSSNVITHVHEGERLLDTHNKNGHLDYVFNISDQIVVVSELIKKLLIEKYKVKKNIAVIPGAVNEEYNFKDDKKEIRIAGTIPEQSFIIMTCGYLGWHKGMDFFLQIARILSSYKPLPLHFVWVGADKGGEAFDQLNFDIEKLKLSKHISILPSIENVLDYINLADIFLTLSRDESFSLVTIEAGLAKKPVLCFDGSGGPCEIVDHDPRFIVPYADVNTMCKRIIDLAENKEEQNQMGDYLYKTVINNYTLSNSAKSLLEVLKNNLN